MNVDNKKKTNDIKKEDVELCNVNHILLVMNIKIYDIFTFRIRDRHFHLTEFDNQKLGLTKTANNYL